MLIALPNTDGSFTATLFLARTGAASFAALATDEAVAGFFSTSSRTRCRSCRICSAEFARPPAGQLGTVHATPWQVAGRVLLLGDARPCHRSLSGQGMNAAFEDCVALDALVARGADWPAVFAQFEQARARTRRRLLHGAGKYTEMRDAVLMRASCAARELAMGLERRFPDRFIRAIQW